MHTLQVRWRQRSPSLSELLEAHLGSLRQEIVRHPEQLRHAGVALRWTRTLLPPDTAEPVVWEHLMQLLDALNAGASGPSEGARYGLRLLAALGWQLELQQCVRCGRRRPRDRAGLLDVQRGGLVCTTCGGGPLRWTASELRSLVELTEGTGSLGDALAERALDLVERCLTAHASSSAILLDHR